MNWTPIKPGCPMPPPGVDVLVTVGSFGNREPYVKVAYYRDERWWCSLGNVDITNVLAWAPLPEPWSPAEGE